MTNIRVWAPRARSVECVCAGARRSAEPAGGGWWEAPLLPPGTDYAFSIEGGPAFPDPRSRRQPHGVHGPSQVVDTGAFVWTDAGFRAPPLGAAVLYELHVGTFTPEGTFDAAAARLDHLVDLGVTHVDIMPVASFPGGRGWGYDGVSLYAPHEAYGGPAGFARFVDACHRRGLATILDVVYNHLGPDGNYLGQYGPYFSRRYHTFWGEAINFDGEESGEVRRFFCDNARMWLEEYHVDGLRLDAIHAIFDESATHVLEQLAAEVEALSAAVGRPLVLIGESDRNDPRFVRTRDAAGIGLDAQWSDDFHHALHAVLTGERTGYYEDFGSLADVARALTGAYVYDGRYSPHRRRIHGRPAGGLSGHRFLGYLQTHDQVGNRARGERIGHIAGARLTRAATALVLTAPFPPQLFQGEEWGATSPFQFFTDHTDPALAEAVRQGRRREFAAFGWRAEDIPDPQAEGTFLASKLDWGEVGREPHASWLSWTRALVKLRRATPDLLDGRMDRVQVAFDEAARWIRMVRGRVTVIANFGAAGAVLPRPAGTMVLASEPPMEEADRVTVAAESAAIWA